MKDDPDDRTAELPGLEANPATVKHVMVYDMDRKAPACVLLQAAFGCGARPAPMRFFDSKQWLTSPTPGMRKIAGTMEEWEQVATMTAAKATAACRSTEA